MMLRSFKSATGDGGGPGSFVGAGAGALLGGAETGTLVAAGGALASASNSLGGGAELVRTTMFVLTWMMDLRGDACGRAWASAGDRAFALFAATAAAGRWLWLRHHREKNQPEQLSAAIASNATTARRSEE